MSNANTTSSVSGSGSITTSSSPTLANLADSLPFDGDAFNITTARVLWTVVNLIIFVLILVGNALTIVAVRTCRRLRSVISNIFILSLAVSDFIVGLALPYHFAFYYGSLLGRKQAFCVFRFFLLIFACCVSILTLISIAVDRYIAIVYALHYRRFMTRRVAYVIITVNWIIGCLIGLIPIFWNKWSTAKECEFAEVLSPWYIAAIITPGFVIIWICMLLIYLRILREATKQAKKIRHSVIHNEQDMKSNPIQHNMLSPDWKSVQIVVFIMGCFTFCWLPYIMVAIAQLIHSCHSTTLMYKMAFSLAMANSALNPIIYSWKNLNFRKAFVRTLRCKSSICCTGNYGTANSELNICAASNEPKHCSRQTDSDAANKSIVLPTLSPCDRGQQKLEINTNLCNAAIEILPTNCTAADR